MPVASTGRSVVVQPRRASALSVVSTASCSIALAIEMTPAGRLERFGHAAQREVVGLGAAAGEDDLGRLGADQRRDRGAGVVEDALWPAGRSDGRSTRCRSRRAAPRVIASATAGATGVVAL